MESREHTERDCPEVKVLETLASIKTQVSSVLQNLQEAREAAAESVVKRTVNMEEVKSPASIPKSDSPASREDVKAQREAKKAAKAARKSKGSGVEGSPVGPPPPASPTTNPALVTDASPTVEKSEGTPKSKAQLKAERRSLQEAQREAKAKGGNTPKKPIVAGTDSPGLKIETDSTPKTPGSSKISDVCSPKPKTPERSSNKSIPADLSPSKDHGSPPSPETEETEEYYDDSELTEDSVSAVEGLAKRVEEIQTEPEPEDLGRVHGLFQWLNLEAAENTVEAEWMHVDPVFKELGLMYSTGMIRGSNQRTLALLGVVKKFVEQYKTPEGKGFKQDISAKLKSSFDRLKLSRPFAVGMTSAVEGLNGAIRNLDEGLSDDQYKEALHDWCDLFKEEKVEKALEAMAQKGAEKIEEGDTILVFSLTEVIFHVFKLAGEQDKKFNLLLVITNSDTYLQDYQQLSKSMGEDVFKKNVLVNCINLSSVMSMIASVNKVFLGGHALFTTGGVMAHAGSSTIALCAMQHNIPTLFFCETYKFCDKSPTDAFYRDVFFENTIYFSQQSKSLDDYVTGSSTSITKERVIVAKIRYDFTPVNLVTCVITDIDMLPSSSVPVVLRVQESRPLMKCL